MRVRLVPRVDVILLRSSRERIPPGCNRCHTTAVSSQEPARNWDRTAELDRAARAAAGEIVSDAHHDDLVTVDAACGVDHWDLISGCDNALVDGGSHWYDGHDPSEPLVIAE
jgi:hypothetical protein